MTKLLATLPGYLGCSADVIDVLDKHCSGKNECELSYVQLKGRNPCMKGLAPYLEVSYICIEGNVFVSSLCFFTTYCHYCF